MYFVGEKEERVANERIGLATIGAGVTKSYSGLLVCRFLVGVFEAGLIPVGLSRQIEGKRLILPACTFLMSQYYKKFEFQRRYSLFFTGSHIGEAFSGVCSSSSSTEHSG